MQGTSVTVYNCYKKIQRGNIKSLSYWLRLHKVLTYVEYRAVPGVFQNIDPSHPHLHPASVS